MREHLPPEAQAFLGRDRAWCAAQAQRIGSSCMALTAQLLFGSVATAGCLRKDKAVRRAQEEHASTPQTSYGALEILTVSTNARSADGTLRLPG